jgi:hypothetical protein
MTEHQDFGSSSLLEKQKNHSVISLSTNFCKIHPGLLWLVPADFASSETSHTPVPLAF